MGYNFGVGEFKVGDIVQLCPMHDHGPHGNPSNTKGIILSLNGPILPIKVKWMNGEWNTYYSSDLIKVTASEIEIEIIRMVHGM